MTPYRILARPKQPFGQYEALTIGNDDRRILAAMLITDKRTGCRSVYITEKIKPMTCFTDSEIKALAHKMTSVNNSIILNSHYKVVYGEYDNRYYLYETHITWNSNGQSEYVERAIAKEYTLSDCLTKAMEHYLEQNNLIILNKL